MPSFCSMPHWINLSYFESTRRKTSGKRYRPRLIPPAGLKTERRRTFVPAAHLGHNSMETTFGT